uniref:TIR domain-containing protein n=1 Tax=Leptobrachium leishanense TaxID=445787 RepID=A0A8C5PG65_9ANUR
MNTYICLLRWLLCFTSIYFPCLCVTRKNCQVMEKQYFQTYGKLMFNHCNGFEQVNFTVAAYCTANEYNLENVKLEIPLETDWLCLYFRRVTLTSGIVSNSWLPNLRSLFIYGYFTLSTGCLRQLPNLLVLWIRSKDFGDPDKVDFGALTNLRELRIERIQYPSLHGLNIDQLKNLEYLKLEANGNINTLASVTKYLTKLKHLQTLYIYQNSIQALRRLDCLHEENSANERLQVQFNISTLILNGADIVAIENNSLCNFPKLSYFKASFGLGIKDIFHSGMKTVDKMSFVNVNIERPELCFYSSFFKVQELQLANIGIKSFKTSNGSCSTLRALDISNNAIEKMSVTHMEKLQSVRDLNMSNNYITELSLCPRKKRPYVNTELEILNMSFNLINFLTHGQLTCLKKLRVLTLDNNRIYTFKNCTFCGLNNLEILSLKYNEIYKIDDYSFRGLFSLKQLNLHDNKLKSIHSSAFVDLAQLEEIALTFTIAVLDVSWLQYITNSVRKLSVKTNIDCIYLTSLYFQLAHSLDSLVIDAKCVHIDSCSEFPYFKIRDLRLSNNEDFYCGSHFQPTLSNFTNLEKLYFAVDNQQTTGIWSLAEEFRNLTKLEYLCLKNTANVLEEAVINPSTLFNGLENLKILHLINSGFEYFSSDLTFKDLKSTNFLILENETIEEINRKVFSPMGNLKYVYLHGIKFKCSCHLNSLYEWILTNKQVSFIDVYAEECFAGSQSNHLNLTALLEKDCNADLEYIMFIVSYLGTLTFILISIFFESIWWYTHYLFYTIKCWLNHRLRGEQNDQYEFDVFVSYNTVDEQWVTEELLHNLEHTGPPFFKVCIHNRDFEIGRAIVENIVDSIYKSRWTVCVITRSYLQSHWCSLEMRMATYRLIAENKDSLLLIFLDKISKEEIQCYHRLTKLLDKNTYLEWPDERNGQELFWARLRKVIGGHTKQNHGYAQELLN